MAEDADPVASVRDEAPKPSSPRAGPAKFDRAMVEAKMRSDGWVTTEKAERMPPKDLREQQINITSSTATRRRTGACPRSRARTTRT